MTKAHPARAVADGLSLAAAPVFAVMAALTAGHGGLRPDLLCSAAGASPLGGMTLMYLLMGVFHAPPWLRLIARRRSAWSRTNGGANEDATVSAEPAAF